MKGIKKLVFVLSFIALIASPSTFANTARYSLDYDENTKRYYAAEPGSVIKGNVVLQLRDPVDVVIKMSLHSMSGGFVTSEGKGTDLDISTWINYPQGMDIEILGSNPEGDGLKPILMPFEITIPEDILPGDYQAALRATLVSKDEDIKAGAGAKLTSAIGLPLKISIPGDRTHALVFNSMNFMRFTDVPGTSLKNAVLEIEYENKGNTVLKPKLELKLKDFKGGEFYEKLIELNSVFPGNVIKKEIVLKELPPFLLWLDFSGNLTYQIQKLEGDVSPEVFEAGLATLRAYFVPWIYLYIFIGLVIISTLFYLYKMFVLSRVVEISKVYTVQNGDTLQTICSRFAVDSHDVIIANKLKAPYFVESGKKLLIPIKNG